MPEIYGQLLPPPDLRFDYANPSAVTKNPRQGLLRYGPYDSGLLGKEKVVCGLLYPAGCDDLKEALIQGLTNGLEHFPGFKSYFRVPLDLQVVRSYGNLEAVLKEIVVRDIDLAIIVVQNGDSPEVYQVVKQWFSANGIPSQIVTVPKLEDQRQRPWVIESMAVACYGKIGGSPWVVPSKDRRREIIIGVSRAIDRVRGVAVGFVTLFNQDGDFLYLGSKAPVIRWPMRGQREEEERYIRDMKENIQEVFEYYVQMQGEADLLTVHLCKRPGPLELAAVQEAIKDWDIPFAILHVNDDTTFRLFDTSHPTYVPLTGLAVFLSKRHALLLLDGRQNGERRRRGIPRLVEVRLDPRSTLSEDEFPRLVHEVSNLSRMNWRGFNAKASPASLNYSYLIANLVLTIGLDKWNTLVSQGRLRDKAWFL